MKTILSKECRTHNERFGATAAGRADLKGSAGKPPLRQAAIPLYVMRRERCRKSNRIENCVQSDNDVEIETDLDSGAARKICGNDNVSCPEN